MAQLPAEIKVVDLGADHRLRDPAAWAAYYPGPHAGTWTYGLPELPGQRELIAASSRVAATGCYAVATILALAPLIAPGSPSPTTSWWSPSSGTTGAGVRSRPTCSASEVMGDVSPYKVGAHQHVPEIRQATRARSLSLTPVLAPMPRGILATVTARPAVVGAPGGRTRGRWPRRTPASRSYALLPARSGRARPRRGSNACHLQATVDVDSGRSSWSARSTTSARAPPGRPSSAPT